MLEPLDPDKMLQQDPAFKRYAEEAALMFVMADKAQALNFVGTIYSFYMIGMTTDQVRNWLKQQRNFFG